MIIKKVFFKSTDGISLFGLLHLPEVVNAQTVIIGVHGFCSASVNHNRDDVIAQTLTDNGYAYFCFNNRGSGIVSKLKITKDGKTENMLGGAAYDKIVDGKFDVVGAIKKMQELGFERQVLQGHSLGCSKIMMTYEYLLNNDTKLLDKIVALEFLSPVDTKQFIIEQNREIFDNIYKIAKVNVNNGNAGLIIPNAMLGAMMESKTMVSIIDNVDEINLPIETDGGNFEKFNNIKCPIFICFGERDYTVGETCDIVKVAGQKIKNDKKMFLVIPGGTHQYKGKEKELADGILKFLSTI